MPASTLLVVGGWVLSPIIKELLGKAKALLASKYRSFKHFGKRLQQLVSVLEQIKDTIEMVHRQHIGVSEGMTSSVSQLMDALNKVEDILDAFNYGDILRTNMARKPKVTQNVHSTVKTGKRLIGRDKAFSLLKELLDELPTIQQSSRDLVQLLQLQATSSHAGGRYAKLATGPVLSEEELFVGYKEEYGRLMSALLSDHQAVARSSSINHLPAASSSAKGNHNTQAVALIGHGGAGKTFIAQRAWNDIRVNNAGHFNLLIWASVSYKFSETDLLAEIWKSILGNRHKSAAEMSFSRLQQKVYVLVMSKRFLLVLHDVCMDESDDDDQIKKTWKAVLAPFRHGEQGSRILMMSRANICSKMLEAGTTITLDRVSTNDLVLLLKKNAFASTPDLDEVITRVAVKLKGSPSVARPVANKVRNKWRKKDWKKILELGYCNEITSVMSANKSSYHNLPQNLQFCLGFCSMFPDNWKFEPEKLVKMWIAHGIISDNRANGTSMEDVGREYIKALKSRSFFKATKQGNATHLVIDEQIHLMLQSVCANYIFRMGDDNRGHVPPTVRHISVTNGSLAQLKNDPMLKKLRTMLLFSDGLNFIDNDVLKQLKAVRVLELAGTSITGLPKGISKLKHLRYLGLPNAIKSIPVAVTKLLHLQTLALGKYYKLSEFPTGGMNSLINLRHLDVDMKYIAMISGLGRLEKIQGSVEFHADKGHGHGMEELAGMNSLHGILSVKGLHAVTDKEEAQKAQVARKEFVKVVRLEWEPKLGTCSTSSHEQVLEGLKPHGNIGELQIRRYQGRSSPSWLKNSLLSSLTHLYLINCRNWEVLPPLGQLPDLKVLHIKEMYSVKQIDHGSSVFQSLDKLVLDDMSNLVEWTVESTESMFPHLRELYIFNCPKLKKLPQVASTVKNMKIDNHNSYCLKLSYSLKANSFTLDIHGDAVQLLQEDFLHQRHIAGISALSIKQHKGTNELNIKLIPSVRSLSLSRCVIGERQLIMCLKKLPSLERLQISDCPEFDAFPGDAILSSLRSLELTGCHPTLEEKLRKGPYWPKISSIPQVHIG